MNVLRLLKTRHYKVKKGNQISLQKQFLSIMVSSSHERKTLNLDLLTLDETIKVRRNELVTHVTCKSKITFNHSIGFIAAEIFIQELVELHHSLSLRHKPHQFKDFRNVFQ